jgi:heat shock protein HtpX
VNRVKTWILIAGLMGVFVGVGALVGGRGGMTIALVLALVFNMAMYWFSDRIAIASTRSKPVTEAQMPEYHAIVRELAAERGMPMPRLYLSEIDQPNAFATGRDPEHAAVSVTRGILNILDRRELRGVLAHELSHVTNRDILINSVAAAIGTAIQYLAMMAFWFGGSDDEDSPLGGFGVLLLWLLAPMAAAIIQMAISRSREFHADESGAELSRDPEALASALAKLEQTSRAVPARVQPAQAHMFIVNPLAGLRGGVSGMFSTHPPTHERIRRLREMATRIQH